MQVNDELDSTVAATVIESKRQDMPAVSKWVPVIVTSVPPTTGPDRGEILCTAGGDLYTNSKLLVEKSTPLLLISSITEPSACAGETHRASVLLTYDAATVTTPKRQASAPEK